MGKHSHNFIDLTGKIFNNLYVIEWDENPPETELKPKSMGGLWKCKCLLCGNIVWGTTYQLTHNIRKSCRICGYLARSKRKKENKYDLSGEYGIGWTYNTNREFYFDLEDYDKIKDFSWKENSNGYAVAFRNNKYILMHRLVTNITDPKTHIDHRYHNNLDNRKSQLRITTCKNNTRNEKLAKNNTSGVTGVSWEKESNKWHSYIWVNGKTIHLGRFKEKEDAIKARKQAEDKYFGEFSYDNSMKGELNEK